MSTIWYEQIIISFFGKLLYKYFSHHEPTSRDFRNDRLFCRASLLHLTLCPSIGSFLYHLHHRGFLQRPHTYRGQSKTEVGDCLPFLTIHHWVFNDLYPDGCLSLLFGTVIGSVSILDYERGRGVDHHPGDPLHRYHQPSFFANGETI